MHKWIYDTAIIGAGVAGLGAAVYTGRFQMKSAVVSETLGGTIILTNDVANYPGFGQITGMDLAEKLQRHVNDYDVDIVEKVVSKIERCPEGCFKVFTGNEYLHPRSIIFATGTEWRKLDIPGEREFTNKGVHYCALCDGALYKDKVIGVVGGSDSAAKEALLLAEYGKSVYIIYRKEKIRPEPINLERVMNHKKIKIINNTSVTAISGDRFISSVTLDKPYKGSSKFKLDALFVEIGHIPLSGLAQEIGVKVNEKGEIKIDRDAKTNIAGVFAAGDVVDTVFKQAITGVAQGATAAYSAYHYVNEHEHICCQNDEE
ncbi:Thioredoxin reductase [subsurface metagenome]|jgi:thioredoxin reductase (NADPH)